MVLTSDLFTCRICGAPVGYRKRVLCDRRECKVEDARRREHAWRHGIPYGDGAPVVPHPEPRECPVCHELIEHPKGPRKYHEGFCERVGRSWRQRRCYERNRERILARQREWKRRKREANGHS